MVLLFFVLIFRAEWQASGVRGSGTAVYDIGCRTDDYLTDVRTKHDYFALDHSCKAFGLAYM